MGCEAFNPPSRGGPSGPPIQDIGRRSGRITPAHSGRTAMMEGRLAGRIYEEEAANPQAMA